MQSHTGSIHSLCIRRANAENSIASAQLTDPLAVALVVPLARVPQAARMRMDDSNQGQPFVPLADDPARQRLPIAIETNMGNASAPISPRRQGREHQGVGFFADSQKHPADFLFPAL